MSHFTRVEVLHPHRSIYLPIRPVDPGEARMEKLEMEKGRVPECGTEPSTPAPWVLIQLGLEEE